MRYAVLSDIHANLTAFKTVLADAKDEWEYVWCLGDVVGYGPDPNECVECYDTCPIWSGGNHDWAARTVRYSHLNPDARVAVN
jgi:predicted phosphodiesterase